MIGYVTVGTNDFEAALKFYDALFASVGVLCPLKTVPFETGISG